MVIARRYVDEMVAHAREGAPEEVCGLLAGDGIHVLQVYRITNSEHSPRFFLMDSQEQLRAVLDIDDKGLDLMAVYHSHPATEPRPSQTDVELASWPGAQYVIVSLAPPDHPEIRSWRIEDEEVTESELTIV